GDLTGFVRTQTSDSLRIVGSDGKEQLARRDDVSDMRPSAISLMPTALLDGLKDDQVRDLMTFLLHEPPTRSRADVEAVLGQHINRPNEPKPANPLNIGLIARKQDH